MAPRPAVVAVLGCLFMITGAALAAPAAADTIEVDHTLSQTGNGDEIAVETAFGVPSGVTSLEVTVPEEYDVHATTGFERTDDRTYEWTRTTSEPSLQYTMAGNRSGDRFGDGLLYAVTDEWAIVASPSVSLRWAGTDAEIERTTRVDGGVGGEYISYIGDYRGQSHEAAGQRFRLVVPAAADLRESPEDIFATFGTAAERLDIGPRDDEVLVIVAPSSVEWAAGGVQRGDADMWVRDDQWLDTPTNTWVHEYVHTRQKYDATDETNWVAEGMADYYASLIPYEEGHVSYEEFRDRLQRGAAEEYDDVRLVDPATYRDGRGDYDKGALVFAHLDYRLRAEADSSIDEVVAAVNDPGEEVTHEGFLEAIEAAGNADIRDDAERYTETTAAPTVPTREAHVDAFGGPEMRYEFASFTVVDADRRVSDSTPTINVGERLETTVRIENVGENPGWFITDVYVDGDSIGTVSGRLGSGETTTRTVTHRFEAAGEYRLEVGEVAVTVVVEETPTSGDAEQTSTPGDMEPTPQTPTPVDAEPTPQPESQPGFGPVVALVALLAVVLFRRR